MARVPHVVRKRKKSKTLGEPEVISREAYEALELDSRLELIRALIPIGLAHVQEELEREVPSLAGPRYSRKTGKDPHHRHGSNPGTVKLAGRKVPVHVPRVRGLEGDVQLASYADLHRVAITNHRLVGFQNGQVTFTVKDYKDGGRTKRLSLAADEFLRRFLLHVLPSRFVRIRHCGLYAARNVNTRLDTARRIVQKDIPQRCQPGQGRHREETLPWWELLHKHTGIDVMVCPDCGARLVRRRLIAAESFILPPARASPRSA